MSFMVKSKTEDSVKCEVVDGGELKSRRHLNVRGKSATLPSITGASVNLLILFYHLSHFSHLVLCFNCFYDFSAEKDWDDIKFGVQNKIDFYAVSFVKDAKVVHELKDYLRSKF